MLTKKFGMQENRIMNQINAIFGAFMVVFYLGIGIYLMFFVDYIDKVIRNIMGVTFLFYGIYRTFRTFSQVREVFFRQKNKEDQERF